MADSLWELRKRVKSYSLNRIVSTRLFLGGNKAMTNGESLRDFLFTATLDWTDEELRKVDIGGIISSVGGANNA